MGAGADWEVCRPQFIKPDEFTTSSTNSIYQLPGDGDNTSPGRNIDEGKRILEDEKREKSNEWFAARVREGYPSPTCEQQLYDTYCRYNGGMYYTAQENNGIKEYIRNIDWLNQCGSGDCTDWPEQDWKVSAKKCMQSGCCYADDAMRMH